MSVNNDLFGNWSWREHHQLHWMKDLQLLELHFYSRF